MIADVDTPFEAVIEAAFVDDTSAFTLDDDDRGVLDEDVLGDELGANWTDVTEDLRDIDGTTIERGTTRQSGPYVRYEAGRLNIVLQNIHGKYDPLNLDAPFPYVSAGVHNLRPTMPIRVRASNEDASDQPNLYFGYVESIVPMTDLTGMVPVVSLSCGDGAARLQASDLPEQTPSGAGDSAGARIHRVLDNIGWPESLRSIDMAQRQTMQATTMAQPAWSEILLTADSDAGAAWLNASGQLVYRTELNLAEAAPTLVIDDSGAGDIRPESFVPGYDVEQLWNVVKLARAGGTIVTAEDPESRTRNGPRTLTRTDLICETDDQVSYLANLWMNRYKNPAYRIDTVVLRLTPETPESVWSKVLHSDLGQTVTFNWRTRIANTFVQRTQESTIRGVQITIGWSEWVVTFTLQPRFLAIGNFVLDFSQLNNGKLS